MVLIRQGLWFLVIGAFLVLADSLCFVALTALGVGVSVANVCARAFGAALGFVLNGKLTFADADGARLGGRRLVRYGIAWALFTVISTGLVASVASYLSLRSAWLAKPLVEGGLAALSFLVAKYWTYR